MEEAILRVESIDKSFAGNRVLDGVAFEARAGRVHALVGENGAGKSTLMNVIGGILQPDSGTIRLAGRAARFSSPLDAIRAGIGIVHQEMSLAPNLSVAQNIFCHREPAGRFGFIRWRDLFDETRALFSKLGIPIDPATRAGALSVGMQQIVEIAKALSLDARVIIMDEPTSALSETEVDRLYGIIDDLKSGGVAIVFISHKLGEVFRVADEISVLRDGLMVSTAPVAETTREAVIRDMVGRHITDLYPPKSSGVGEELLSVEGLTRRGKFRDVTFSLRRREILGFAGLVGSGRTEVARAIFGADPIDSGRIALEGRPARLGSPRRAVDAGVCYLTEDRKALGLFLTMSVRRNIVAASLERFTTRAGFLRPGRMREGSIRHVNRMQIRPFDDGADALSLSGGNQQKTLLAKWLCARPKVLIVDEPTRGVDVGAKAKIHSDLRELAEEGVGVIVISSELPELLGLSDRVAVFREGRIRAVEPCEGLTQEMIMRHATV